jgi:diaminohydroxyphosphoribosylaminopyrimidine deaminase/5-amino-6-(5-phosphoribosylamino)uracil reductase
VATEAEVRAMRRAVSLAARGLGSTSPNPVVACVVLDGQVTQPLRVVVDTEATVKPGARVLDQAAPTLIAVADDAATDQLRRLGAEVLRLPRVSGGRGLRLADLLAALHERAVRSVLLEGGPTLAGAFLAAGAVDKVIGSIAPALLGAGPAALADAAIPTIARAARLALADVAMVGPDLRITAYPAYPANPAEES